MTNSQNGWAIDTSGAQQDRSTVAGVTFPNGVRKGDVATVLFYVARRFHAEVEPLKKGTCWGWYNRPIRGSEMVSNHASGTAIDLNADKHPLGAVGTFNSTKRGAIRRILDACDGVVRWGGDYSGRKDEMHFEINRSLAAVSALARKIRTEQEDTVTPADRKAIVDDVVAELKPLLEQAASAWDDTFNKAPNQVTAGARLGQIAQDTAAIREAVIKTPAPKPDAL